MGVCPACVENVLHEHQPFRMRIWQWAQQDCIHHAEDGSVGPDSNSENQYGNKRESGIFFQYAKGKANVLNESFHTSPYARV